MSGGTSVAGEAIIAYMPDSMFSVQLREAAAHHQYTVSLVKSVDDYLARIGQVGPGLVVLDLSSAGAFVERMVAAGQQSGARVIGFGPPAQADLLAKAQAAGCDAVYLNSKFKMDTREILTEWMGDAHDR